MQRDETRARFLAVARRTFTRHGFERTTVGMVCRAAKVTHGALYHHFPSKTDLFRAVLEELTAEIAAGVEAAAAQATGWEQVEAACDAYLDACVDPSVQVILFRDGPRALSTSEHERIDHATNEPLVVGLLRRWIAAGLIRPLPLVITARILGGAFAEAGASIAVAEHPKRARADAEAVLQTLIGSLRAAELPRRR